MLFVLEKLDSVLKLGLSTSADDQVAAASLALKAEFAERADEIREKLANREAA